MCFVLYFRILLIIIYECYEYFYKASGFNISLDSNLRTVFSATTLYNLHLYAVQYMNMYQLQTLRSSNTNRLFFCYTDHMNSELKQHQRGSEWFRGSCNRPWTCWGLEILIVSEVFRARHKGRCKISRTTRLIREAAFTGETHLSHTAVCWF